MADDDNPTADLVVRARAGDRRGWEALVERFSGRLWWEARRHRLSPEDAADVVQLTWLRCLEHLDTLRNPGALGGWLVTTCRRERLRVLCTTGRCVPADVEDSDAPPVESLHSPAVDPLEEVIREEAHASLRSASASLPPRQRDVLVTLMSGTGDGRSYADASRRLGIPVGSLGPTRQRALSRLRADPRQHGLD